MGIYEDKILPLLIDRACSAELATRQRQLLIPQASGRVLEIGMGSGLNLPFYDPERVEHVWGLEPSEKLRRMAQKRLHTVSFPVTLLPARAEAIPLPDQAVDTVVTTYTLCSIADVQQALREMYRVLKPGGQLLFCEHGQAPEARVQRWQRRLTPVWKHVSGGCHLDRNIPQHIQEAGFQLNHLEEAYKEGPRILTYHYWGSAIKPEQG